MTASLVNSKSLFRWSLHPSWSWLPTWQRFRPKLTLKTWFISFVDIQEVGLKSVENSFAMALIPILVSISNRTKFSIRHNEHHLKAMTLWWRILYGRAKLLTRSWKAENPNLKRPHGLISFSSFLLISIFGDFCFVLGILSTSLLLEFSCCTGITFISQNPAQMKAAKWTSV